jgi:hypothetical protein
MSPQVVCLIFHFLTAQTCKLLELSRVSVQNYLHFFLNPSQSLFISSNFKMVHIYKVTSERKWASNKAFGHSSRPLHLFLSLTQPFSKTLQAPQPLSLWVNLPHAVHSCLCPAVAQRRRLSQLHQPPQPQPTRSRRGCRFAFCTLCGCKDGVVAGT